MNLFHYPIGDNTPDTVNVIIEIGKDTNTKYEYDCDLGVITLDRCLISSMRYPINYGFIPQTIGDDGDPLDVLIYSSETIAPGSVVKNCNIIGGLDMRDDGVKDYKLLAIPNWNTANIRSIYDVPETFLNITRDFFRHYKNLQDKKVIIRNWFDKKKSTRIISRGIKLFNEKYS